MDAVVLANYFHEHAPFAIKALKAGKHVMSECAACSTLAEGVELCRTVEQTGKLYMLAENYPFTAFNLELARLYKQGEIGRVLYAEGEYIHPGSFDWASDAPGTEKNPFLAGPALDGPRHRGSALPAEVLAELSDGNFFIMTTVARDGTISKVELLEGDAASARPLMDALRRQRYEPARYQGRPVAVSLYRLISRMEVRAPLT